VKPLAEKKGLTFSFAADPAGAPYTIMGDGAQIGDHVLRNLMENSVNYTPTGNVAVTLTKANGKVIFAVKDTGIGISDEDKKNLFTEGGHGKDSIKVNVHSTGYGLYIAKNIVVAHNGTVRAESDGPGKGSRFVVEFPTA
jgi:signal transduction histidine kinase